VLDSPSAGRPPEGDRLHGRAIPLGGGCPRRRSTPAWRWRWRSRSRSRLPWRRERERAERLLLNVLTTHRRPAQAARGRDRRRLPRRHRAVRRPGGLYGAQPTGRARAGCGGPRRGCSPRSTASPSARELEMIKTIGDAYMVSSGLPDPRADHAQAVADMALDVRDEVARRTDPSGQPLQVRIGIDTAGGGRRHRPGQVQLRVGRHRQHRQPHRVPRGARLHPRGFASALRACEGWSEARL
jgi:Adenylate and Guanylate cyclase catalytic domain